MDFFLSLLLCTGVGADYTLTIDGTPGTGQVDPNIFILEEGQREYVFEMSQNDKDYRLTWTAITQDVTPEPEPEPLPGTLLQQLADSLQPGEWGELVTNNFDGSTTGTMYVPRWSDGKLMHIAGWTDDATWDSQSHRLLYMGFRQATKFLQYDEALNEWSELPVFDWPFDQSSGQFGHVYGNNAFDGANYYHWASDTTAVYKFNGAWSQLPLLPMYDDSATSLEWSVDLGLMAFSRQGVKRLINNVWTDFAQGLTVEPYHALVRQNKTHRETLLIKDNTVNVIDWAGNVHVKSDIPAAVTINNDKLLEHPTEGTYLVFVNVGSDTEARALYHYDSINDVWTEDTEYTDPHTKYEKPITATVPEYGVILFIDKKVRVYKPRF